MARFNRDNIRYNAPIFDFDEINPEVDYSNYKFNYKEIKPYILNKSFSACIKLYKKEFLDKYDDFYFDTGLIFEDVPFHVKTLLRAEKISYIPKYFYYYRQNPNSIMNTNKNREDIYKIIEIVEKFLKENNYYKELENEFKCFKLVQISQYILEADTEEYFKKAKEELKQINTNNKLIPNEKLETYEIIMNSNTLEEYKLEKIEKHNTTLKKQSRKNRKTKHRIIKFK